ncbi:MAG: carbohydrate kinase family protein [Candidatus Paceibacterota bacterium]|jgi:sugar/nucleoside kinase (ribokinase family)
MFSKPLDLLAIGDITIDAFIKLKEAEVHCDVDRDECQICMDFASKVPYESVEEVPAVGNSANAAVSAARLGLQSGLVAHLGADKNGRTCLSVLRKEKVRTKYVSIEKGKKTNYHYVLWYDAERTILVKHQDFKYSLPNLKSPKWIYLSSLASGTEKYHQEIISYLAANPKVKLAFQPGTFQMVLGTEFLAPIYQRSEIFICNVQEAEKILKLGKSEIKVLLAGIRTLGPKTVLITDGPKGSYLLDDSGSYFMMTYPDPKPPYERTGAGDAFASTFVSAVILGNANKEALMWASINAMSVVQKVGAQKGLLSPTEIKTFLDKAPTDFRPVTI